MKLFKLYSYKVGYSSVIVVCHSVIPSVHPSIPIFVTAIEQKVEKKQLEKETVSFAVSVTNPPLSKGNFYVSTCNEITIYNIFNFFSD